MVSSVLHGGLYYYMRPKGRESVHLCQRSVRVGGNAGLKEVTYFYRAHTFLEYPACRCASTGYGGADVAVLVGTLYPLKQRVFLERDVELAMVALLKTRRTKSLHLFQLE